MSEIRKNYMTGEWVLISEERSSRPVVQSGNNYNCPFCPANEYMTPKEIYRSKSGRIRVMPNKFPAISEISINGKGIHEVLIDTDMHNEDLHEFSIENIMEITNAFKARFAEIQKNTDIAYIQIFKNNGAKAGASIEHSHWQIIAVPFIPETQRRMNEYFNIHEDCYICELLNSNETQIIFKNEYTAVFCPPAPKFENEVWIVPVTHYLDITEIDDETEKALCVSLKKTLSALTRLYKFDFSYNICFYNACVNMERSDMHFFIQIIPRNGSLAGFELATDSFINALPPEKSAEKLRDLIDFC